MATWQIVDESCNINFIHNSVSVGTYAKELITLEIVLAGEPLNDTLVDNVFVLHDGKYGVEIPYNDTTGVYASAEALRVAIVALINTNPCASGGGGSVGSLQQVTDIGSTTTNTMEVTTDTVIKSTIANNQVRSGDNGTQLESTLNSDGTVKSTDNGDSTYTQLNPDGSITYTGLHGSTIGTSRIGVKKIHLTSAQIQTGNSVPIVLIAAAGAGTAIYTWHDTTARCINGAVPFAATDMQIKSVGGSRSHITWDSANFLTSTTSNPIKGDDSIGINDDVTIIENADLIAIFNGDNLLCDATIDIYLKYEIITL